MKELEEALPDDKADVSLPNFVSKVVSSLIQLQDNADVDLETFGKKKKKPKNRINKDNDEAAQDDNKENGKNVK